MKVAVEIPDFLTVEQYQKLNNLEHLTELDKVIHTISIISDIAVAEIKTWDTSIIPTIYKDIAKPMEHNEEFHAIFKWEEQLYGFANIDKMSLGEFTDLERLSEDPIQNLHEIMAIMYRPVKKHIFNNFFWKQAHKVLLNKRKIDNVFKYYKLKKYDSEDRFSASEIMKQLPLEYALGALGFFLGNVSGYLTTIQPYSTVEERVTKRELMKINLNLLVSIGGGLRQFINYPKEVFSISQGQKVSLT
tara:strand:- start:6155 stop:6892 length:738 start_codon:yes stop_codon:yes gene_type:complete